MQAVVKDNLTKSFLKLVSCEEGSRKPLFEVHETVLYMEIRHLQSKRLSVKLKT